MGEHREQDEIDTAKVVLRENTRVEFQSIIVAPNQRTQLEIAPETNMENPILFMSQEPGNVDVTIEQIIVGHFVILVSPGHVTDFKFGRPLGETVTPRESLKIVLRHSFGAGVKVGASLIVSEKPGTYKIVDREKINQG